MSYVVAIVGGSIVGTWIGCVVGNWICAHSDGPKRPPELSPEERKKRADQRDRGVLNDGNGCGPPSESGGR